MRRLLATASFASVLSGSLVSLAVPSGFTKSRVVSGLTKPTAMAFAPDGRIFVTERGTTAGGTGKVRIIKNGSLLSTPFVSISVDNVTISPNERGLLGIAIDPNFSSNHYIYVYYTVPGSTAHNRISRFTANGDVAVSGSEKQLLNLNNLSAGNHNGGGMLFGRDGKLYIGVGENHNSDNATNLGNYLGKVLRINSDGSAPSDNPFYNSSDGINSKDRIWTYGHRNPFTLGVHPTSGRIFANDVGEAEWEEINDLVKGKDFGWRGGTSDGDSTAWYKYDHNAGKCIAGGTFYDPPNPPGTFSNYLGYYFFADYVNGWIKAIKTSTKSVSSFESSLSGPLDIDVGPDGNLYYLLSGSGEVWKVSTSGSSTQNIVLSTNVMNVTEGSSGTFKVNLAKQPSSNVTVSLARTSGDGSITISPTSLTFSSSNWSTPQSVKASAASDSDNITKSAAITASSSGLSSQKIVVNAVDDDSTGPHAILSLPREADTVKGVGAEFYGGSNLDGSTAKAQFYIDGALKYTDVGPGHYHFNGSHQDWDTTLLKEGSHTLKFVVYDTSNRTGTHQISVNVDNLPSPWNHQDVGAVGSPGSAMSSSGTYTVNGSGADIWGAADEFQFVYKKLSGDGEIKARVTSVENTNSWAKAGVMMRESLNADAKQAIMLISAAGTLAFQRRASTGGTSASTQGSTVSMPRWVRLKRAGTTLTAYSSTDGSSWSQLGSSSISFPTDVYIGLAVSSHADGTVCTGKFDNVSTSGTTSAYILNGEGDPDEGADPNADVTLEEASEGDGDTGGGCGGTMSGVAARGTAKGIVSALLLGLALTVRRRRK
jgi:glucose/arabinose dehydrogenase